MAAPRTIDVGGGLTGLSAAHTLLENGASVLRLEQEAIIGTQFHQGKFWHRWCWYVLAHLL
ncbi:hypothetical protein BDZ89DRAFT_1145399 [Hymenopellis radicata]|nr:hypothetical protein BDZ89DRAFT_1145399 [Hymenopellis radicata]